MSIAAINNPVSLPRRDRGAPGARPSPGTAGQVDARRRGTPVERVIEGEVVTKPGASGGEGDPFARARFFGQEGGASGDLRAMLGISAYLANATASPAGGGARYVDYYA